MLSKIRAALPQRDGESGGLSKTTFRASPQLRMFADHAAIKALE